MSELRFEVLKFSGQMGHRDPPSQRHSGMEGVTLSGEGQEVWFLELSGVRLLQGVSQ